MKSNVLSEVLKSHGGCEEADGTLSASGGGLTIYVTLGQAMLPIERIEWVKVADESVVIQTRSDRYVFAHEDIRGVRLANAKSGVGYSS